MQLVWVFSLYLSTGPERESLDMSAFGQILIAELPVYRAQEMVGAVIFLVSPGGGYTNGQEIIVDGGYLAVNPSRV